MSPSCISSLDTSYQLNVNILTVYKITNNTDMVHIVFWLRLFLPQNLFIDMKTDYQDLCCMTLCSDIMVMLILYVCVKPLMNSVTCHIKSCHALMLMDLWLVVFNYHNVGSLE